MLKLLERNIALVGERLVLLAPPTVAVPSHFRNVTDDGAAHDRLVRQMQRLRGSVYLSEGNVRRDQLTADGLHQTAEDGRSWHLVMTDRHQRVTSCAWYMEHENTATVQHLRVRSCPLARDPRWQAPLVSAVESELARARRVGLRYAEVGGWAVAKERRCTSEGLLLALGAYGLCRILGGALGLTTANVKHSSSSILRRLGGSYLEYQGSTIPAYHDPRYNADIELLRFDSRRPASKYMPLIERLQERLAGVPVLANPSYVRPAWTSAGEPKAMVA